MSELPTNLTPIAYLRNTDLERFDIINFCKYFHLEDVATATQFFKNTIKNVLSFSKRHRKKERNQNILKFAKAMKANRYSILNSPELVFYFIQCGHNRTSLNREMAFASSAVEVSESTKKTSKRPLSIKIIYEKDKEANNEENNSSNKKRKFEENDCVFIDGLTESLGTKIGKDARLQDTPNTKKKNYFKTCGMNGIIDLSDIMSGSQLDDLPKAAQEKILEKLTEKTYITKNTMGNKDFLKIIEKVLEPGVDTYECIQELDEIRCTQDMYGSKSVHRLILYNIFSPLPIENFSEADYIINIWAPLFKYTFCKTLLWSHWGDTVPTHLKDNSNIYIKLDFRLSDKKMSKHDWATGEIGTNVVDWKYFTDKTKLILTSKSQLNELFKTYPINHESVSQIKIPFVQILGVDAIICYMELHGNGLYKIIQVVSFKYPTTKNCIRSKRVQGLIRGLSALRDLSLDLYEFICDMERSSKVTSSKEMDRSVAITNNVDDVNGDVRSWVRELWFPPNFNSI